MIVIGFSPWQQAGAKAHRNVRCRRHGSSRALIQGVNFGIQGKRPAGGDAHFFRLNLSVIPPAVSDAGRVL